MPIQRIHRRFLPPIRSWFRFSLRTLMIVTVVAAFAVRWWMKPVLTSYAQPDGAIVAYSLSRAIDPVSKKPGEARRHGRYELRDKFGHLLVRGQYENGIPVGTWRVFHSNGTKAIHGTAVSGEHAGPWTAWNDAGDVISKVTYQIPSAPHPVSAGKFAAPWESERVGVGETRDDLGNSHRGTIVKDLREGEWTSSDATGRVFRRGEYHFGVRHGRTLDTSTDGTTRESYYLYGRLLPPLTELLPQLQRDLQSEDGGRQYEALRTVVLLGTPSERLLLQVLVGNDLSLKISAMRLLAESRATENVLRELEQLTRAPEPTVSMEAWFTLFQLRPNQRSETARELVALAARSELPIRYRVVDRLGRQPGPIPEAIDIALGNSNPTIRRVAMETLAVMVFAPRAFVDSELNAKLEQLFFKARSSSDAAISAAAAEIDRKRP